MRSPIGCETLRTMCADRGRDARELDHRGRAAQPHPSDRDRLIELGVSELVIVDSPPADPADVPAWIAELGNRWC